MPPRKTQKNRLQFLPVSTKGKYAKDFEAKWKLDCHRELATRSQLIDDNALKDTNIEDLELQLEDEQRKLGLSVIIAGRSDFRETLSDLQSDKLELESAIENKADSINRYLEHIDSENVSASVFDTLEREVAVFGELNDLVENRFTDLEERHQKEKDELISAHQTAMQNVNAEYAKLSGRMELMTENQQTLEHGKAEVAQALEQLKGRYQTLSDQHQDLVTQKTEVTGKLESLQKERQTFVDEEAEATRKLGEVEKNYRKLEIEKAEVARELVEVKGNYEILAGQHQTLGGEKADADRLLKEAREKCQSLTEGKEDIFKQLKAAQMKQWSLDDEKNQLAGQLTEAKKAKEDSEKEKEALSLQLTGAVDQHQVVVEEETARLSRDHEQALKIQEAQLIGQAELTLVMEKAVLEAMVQDLEEKVKTTEARLRPGLQAGYANQLNEAEQAANDAKEQLRILRPALDTEYAKKTGELQAHYNAVEEELKVQYADAEKKLRDTRVSDISQAETTLRNKLKLEYATTLSAEKTSLRNELNAAHDQAEQEHITARNNLQSEYDELGKQLNRAKESSNNAWGVVTSVGKCVTEANAFFDKLAVTVGIDKMAVGNGPELRPPSNRAAVEYKRFGEEAMERVLSMNEALYIHVDECKESWTLLQNMTHKRIDSHIADHAALASSEESAADLARGMDNWEAHLDEIDDWLDSTASECG